MTSHPRHPAIGRTATLLAALILGGCAAATPPGSPATTSPGSQAPSGSAATLGSPAVSSAPPSQSPATTLSPAPDTTPAPSAATASCPDRTLASLTEAQRIGQVFMIGLIDDRLDAGERAGIADHHFGSVTFTTQTAAGITAVRTVTDSVQALATEEATGGVPFLIAANQEGGRIQGLSGPGFDTIPSALVQGTLAPATLQRRATTWGRQLRAAGIDLDLAPVADVVPAGTEARNAPIGQLQREFGHDPGTVASHVAAFVAGMSAAGIGTTVKHFPGLGRVAGNTDDTAQVDDQVTTRHDPYLEPFAAGIKAGVPFVMVSLATYERIDPSNLAVFSPTVIGSMLRGDLGFRGVVISDALGATAVASIPPATRAIDFIDAGGDLIISNQLAPAIAMATAVAGLARTDAAFRARVDQAALHVLAAKDALGLLACGG
jgi:beta-N-acetylhexosaminidase